MFTDIPRLLGAVTRIVRRQDHEGRPARVVVASRGYDTTVDDLWDALTNPERIPRWFMPISGDLRLGGQYQLHGNASGTITACDPPSHLGVTWEFGGQVSWVEVRLTPRPDGRAHLELEHIAHVPEDWWAKYGPGATGVGWDLALMGLERYLETREQVDHAAAEAWTLSPDGRAFMSGSGASWRDAAIADGDAPEAAAAAAARTFAFYTGAPDPDAPAEP